MKIIEHLRKKDKYLIENLICWSFALLVGFLTTYFSPREFSEEIFTIIGLQITLIIYVMLRFWK